jgi:hypothetical protein
MDQQLSEQQQGGGAPVLDRIEALLAKIFAAVVRQDDPQPLGASGRVVPQDLDAALFEAEAANLLGSSPRTL